MSADPGGTAPACDQQDPGRTGRVIQITLPPAAEAARLARQHTRDALARWNLEALTETATLLVSELVGNVVRHASTGTGPHLRITAGRRLRIAVTDADPRPPQPRQPIGSLEESGFGFVLVDALATRWGVDTTTTGKTVWIELDPPRPGPAGQPGPRPSRNPAIALGTWAPDLARSAGTATAHSPAHRSGPAARRGR